jgi:RHS repeat-associated protein
LPLAFARSYSSLSADVSGRLGYGWTDSYGMSLTLGSGSPPSPVTVNQENGTTVAFTWSGSAYTAPPRVMATLVRNGGGSFTFTRHGKDIFEFSSTGKLTAKKDLNGYTTSLSYNGSGQLTTVTEPGGRALTFTYTGAGLIDAMADSTGRTVDYSYDGSSNLTDVVDVRGGHAQYTYDGSHQLLTMRSARFYGDTTTTPSPVTTNVYTSGKVTSQTDPRGKTTTFAYTEFTTTITDPEGNAIVEQYVNGALVGEVRGFGTAQAATTLYTYDPATLGRTSAIDPLGRTSTATFDGDGNQLTATDPLGRTTTWTYNSLRDVTSITDPAGVTTSYTYDGAGNRLTESTPLVGSSPAVNRAVTYTYGDGSHPGDVTAVTDPDGKTSTFAYDGYGNQTSRTDPLGDQTTATFNTRGFRVTVVSPRGNVSGGTPANYTTTYTSNPFGQVLTATDPLSHVTTTTYDADGHVATVVDPTSQTTMNSYDPAGNLVTVTRPDATTRTYTYNGNSQRLTDTDGASHATSWAYNNPAYPKLPTTMTDPLSRVTTYGYDQVGNRITLQQHGGNCAATPKTSCITYAFDAAHQLAGIDYSSSGTPDVTGISYDADGRRAAMTDGTGTTTYSWDSLGRLISSAAPSGTVGYGWNLRGLVTSIVYPNSLGTVTRAYDNAGRLASVTDWLSHTTTSGYDPDSNLTSQINPNGTTNTTSFDRAGQTATISDAPTATPASPFVSFNYGRDNENKLTSVTSTGVPADNHTWGYTSIDQVKTDTAQANNYGYDAADNLTQQANGARQAFDVANQLGSSTSITKLGTGGASNSNASTAAVTLPAGVAANDQILLGATYPGNRTVTTPSGYTLVGTWQTGTTSSHTKMSVFRKTAAGGETSVTVTFSATFAKAVVAIVYRGVSSTTPIDVSSSATSTTNTLVLPSVTTTTAGDQLVGLLGATQGASQAAVWAAPTGMVKQVERSIAATDGAIVDQALGAAGATGTRTATLGTTGKLVGALIALKPASTTYSYDTLGNRTQTAGPTGTAVYSYNQANQLVSVANGTATSYTHNGDGLRVGRTGTLNTTFRWDLSGQIPLLLVDGTTAYIYGAGSQPITQINGTTPLTYHADQLGSTRALTNSAGAVVATYSYDPYGNPTGTTGSVINPFRYAGDYTDTETGFLYLRARHYDPATAEFLQRDPAIAITAEAYGYVGGNPLNVTDPNGENWLSDRVSSATKAAKIAATFVYRNPTLAAGIVAGVACIASVGCGVATAAAASFAIGKSYYDNLVIRNRPGSFIRDTAITLAFVGSGALVSGFGRSIPGWSLAGRASSFFEAPGVGRTVSIYGSLYSSAYGGLIDFLNNRCSD